MSSPTPLINQVSRCRHGPATPQHYTGEGFIQSASEGRLGLARQMRGRLGSVRTGLARLFGFWVFIMISKFLYVDWGRPLLLGSARLGGRFGSAKGRLGEGAARLGSARPGSAHESGLPGGRISLPPSLCSTGWGEGG